MRQAGVLSKVLPESEKWGIDAIHGLVAAERDLGWGADAMLRLAAMVPPDAERMLALAERLKLSKAEAARLERWASAPKIEPAGTESDLRKKLYRSGRQPVLDRLRLGLASARARAVESNDAMIEAGGYARQLKFAGGWKAPKFPLKGADLQAIGVPDGREMGKLLKRLEEEWVEADFRLDSGALLERAARHCAEELGRVADLLDAGADGLDHRLANDRLAMRLAHVLGGPAHDLGLFLMARVPVAAGNQRTAVELLHRSPPFLLAVSCCLGRIITRNGAKGCRHQALAGRFFGLNFFAGRLGAAGSC